MSTDQPKSGSDARSSHLSTESYKGVRDFFPEEYYVHEWILNTMREAVKAWGYTEYDASILEPTELYASKTSDEIVNEQTYTFTDRGERSVTLRPEMTPTVARMIAAKWREYPQPIRWFSIPNVFRYEKPQRGRLREHWQLNVDLFDSPSVEGDVELIAVAAHIMKAFGASESDFVIRVNNRHTINEVFAQIGVTEENKQAVLRAIDKGDREKNADPKVRELVDAYFAAMKADAHTEQVIETLKRRGVTNVQFDPAIMRGFTYYTGIVFEVFDTHKDNNRSLFGGGRYDNLAGMFTEKEISGIGFGMGDVTMHDFLDVRGKLPAFKHPAHLFIASASANENDSATADFIATLASELRTAGVRVSTNITDKKVGDQIKYADKLGIPNVVVIGPDEVQTGSFTLKALATGEETKVDRTTIAQHLTK